MRNCKTRTTSQLSPSDHTEGSDDTESDLWLRAPTKFDAAGIHTLISECPPLDLNSLYTYLLLSEHFCATSVVAGSADKLLGFISGYRRPEAADTLFVWQVAVHADARGRGLGQRMLRYLLDRPTLEGVRYIETTVGPENQASRGMFASLARRLNAPVHESPLFDRSLFGEHGHDDEPLLRIGPFRPAADQLKLAS
ncbi:diaminobutyrate acetyltransferase [Alcaligenaceae bacterium]|nr:diaminobutyrate acetyltransferase [Alcaligenaceae bacterium]